MSKNLLQNKETKEFLANSALSILINKNILNLNDIGGTTVEFGYIFELENKELEALFKLTTLESTYYFAAQKGKLLLLTINEAQYKEVAIKMNDLHN